jgi:hypothetical protein
MRMRPKNPVHATDVQLSQSALEYFCACPKRFHFATQWNSKDKVEALEWGTQAHALLANQAMPEDPGISNEACYYADTLEQVAYNHGITVNHHEVSQYLDLGDGITFRRIVDGIGTWKVGKLEIPVIMDWKTCEKGEWYKANTGRGKRISPKAMTFQAASYLIPPPQDEIERLGLKEWPTTMVFVIGDMDGHGEVIAYEYNQEDVDNFYAACQLVRYAINTESFPKVRGYACGQRGGRFCCAFFDLCYQIKGWEEHYDRTNGDWDEAAANRDRN